MALRALAWTVVGALCAAHDARATTWFDTAVTDPLAPEATCTVHEWGSYGSYVYGWPSKYDQVFWPYTDDKAIWYCGTSGFAAFVHDFELTPVESERIAAFLKEHPAPGDAGSASRLKWLEAIYALRDKEPDFRLFLLRLFAYRYEELGDIELANSYRARALAAMQAALQGELREKTRLEYVYVCANYARKLGDPKRSDEYLEQLRTLIAKATPKEAEYARYLEKLSAETPRIGPGGKLQPPR